MSEKIRLIQYGVGSIGSGIVRLASQRQGMIFVGAIDSDREKAGRDLGEVAGIEERLGVSVSNDPDRVFAEERADVVLHSTISSLHDVYPQITKALEAGANVISTSEELAYPHFHHPEFAAKVDKLAKASGVTVLGTGVNPGFVLDALPLTLTGVCQEVKRIKATRILDASLRRLPLQRKIGAGLTPEEFKRRVDEGKVRHVGLPESAVMIADGLGWRLDELREEIGPVIAESLVESRFMKAKAGEVAGVRQLVHGIVEGEEKIVLELQMYLGARTPRDSVEIVGVPNLNLTIEGGVSGDVATVAVVVNSIPRVMNAEPGLVTMKDLPVPSATLGNVGEFLKRH